ncbi:cytochrome c1 [Oleiphilus messinensis]|uniref:Cytochrome c1 n=1 Tax=Oleiphilus messinensis TaxID=141451 RepID=A0A1Y0IDV6_9GAMM|nr:cytochrome c1 [Oleiphilus messinensis]ARU58708.1 cytochrome c1 [Oleiphilus messinensis]
MKKFITALAFVFAPVLAMAAGGPGIPLDHMKPDLEDRASLQRGAALATNYCMGCHSFKFARYERVATDLGIPNDLYEKNLIFTGAKIGELMHISMDSADAKGWFGNPPPDLSLEARLRGTDWLYSYLRAFYVDDSRPYGVNNTIFPDVGMPHVLADLQGVCAEQPHFGVEPQYDPLSGRELTSSGCKEYAVKGSLSPEEYDKAMYDLVNFLAYMGEPSKLESHRLGKYVLAFLAFLFIFVYFLNREYWKDVH